MGAEDRQSTDRIKTGVVMDPITGINIKKDSTFAMLLEAQARSHEVLYMEPADLCVRDGRAFASMRSLKVQDDPENWFSLGDANESALEDLDIILMR